MKVERLPYELRIWGYVNPLYLELLGHSPTTRYHHSFEMVLWGCRETTHYLIECGAPL